MFSTHYYAALATSTAALLVACGGSQSPIGAPGAMPQSRAVANHAERGRSWILSGAKNGDLLYISDYYGVHMYTFPKGQYLGDIGAFGYGLCSDRAGDVFVPDSDANQVYEYAHGGTKRLKTLYDTHVDFHPIDCSVDPTTGKVAISSLDSGFVVVYPKAEDKPEVYYEDMADTHMSRCAYDNKGDLFVDQVAKGGKNYIGELPRGATKFTNYVLDTRIGPPGGIQFDGKHVAIGDLGSHIVYRLRFSGSKAIIVGGTPLNGTTSVEQYWIQGKTLIGPDGNSTVYLWKYPGGGSPVSSIQGFTLDFGSTVSIAPSR